MNPTFLSRLHAAASLIFKSGAPFPFNKIMPYDAMGGEKMYRPYEQSAWVMRAIKKIAGPISAVGLEFTRKGQPFVEEELEAFWETPAAGLTRSDFFEATVGWLKLEGEAFWILDDSWLAASGGRTGAGGPGPLIVARPDRMRHIVKNGVLTGWEYVDGAGKSALLLPEQVVQTKMWNPYNEWRGLAELKPCRDAAEADFLAGKFNLNLMRNNGDQGVYVIAKNGVPTDDQRQQIVDQIREKRELAQRGVFKPVFLGGDIVIEDPKIRVPDKAFNATRLQNRHEIFIALGVPASMADVQASYSIGSASDWFMLISETCIPTGEKICAAISQVVRRQSGLDARARLNWDEHPVIQSVRRERADTAQKYFQMGVPLQVLNDYLDLELPACPEWDKGYLPFNVTPIGGTELPAKTGTPPEPMDDTVALMRASVDAVARLKSVLNLNHNPNPNLNPLPPARLELRPVSGERLVRLIHPEARIVDAARGIVDYIASDESIDSYREVIRASGWRFNHFAKNAPFVDSHDYSTIEKCLGRVVDFRVEGGRLIERVQWAIDVPENKLAQIGWKMTQAGYLKAVSVGFFPVKYVTPSSGDAWTAQLKELGLPPDAPVRTIYTEQEQVELSCCVVGANPNALAKAYQAGAINDSDMETLSLEYARRECAGAAGSPAQAAPALEQARRRFLEKLQRLINKTDKKKI